MNEVGDIVTVRLFGGLEQRSRERRTRVAIGVATASTVAALIASLEIPSGAVGLILVNGLHAGPLTAVAGGDTVAFFPPVGGG